MTAFILYHLRRFPTQALSIHAAYFAGWLYQADAMCNLRPLSET